ncbi:hypothetical protein IV454_20850 [Massilia antarctica]|uniref:PKD domain-containing protein n=1 Tax=Massilia antarctica TaxID=2765360 RepID=A0AA48W8K5_9BURK|nr:hypothetical protein [Massilia antarctica]QPI47997.1 hypothetical protein IV454_20850 [Massilia antarctica]
MAATLWGCGGGSGGPTPPEATILASVTVRDAAATGPLASPADTSAGAADELGIAAGAPGAAAPDAVHGRKEIYGIVNLAPPPIYIARINARGQATFEYTALDDRLHVGFFDGARVIDVNPPDALVTTLGALNDRGEVAAQIRFARDPVPTPFQPFRWTANGGRIMLATLNAEGDSFVTDINNFGEIVGASRTGPGDEPFRAVRWTAQNRLLPLPVPAGFGQSFTGDINERNVSVGAADDAAGHPHVLIWDADGRVTDLGTFGATTAGPVAINNRGEIVGLLNAAAPDFQTFLFSPGQGAIRVGPATVATRLNEFGELVGRIVRPNDENHAFLFSRKRGLVDLHPPQFILSEAGDINDSGTVVGLIRRAGDAGTRAFRWSRAGLGADLNTLLKDAPAGLVLTHSLRISANGDILSNSNVGLVLLRPGGGGTDAPVLGPIRIGAALANQPARLTLSFRDRNGHDTHTATIDWGDLGGAQPARVRESRGRGEVSAAHTYAARGSYAVVVRVADSGGKTTFVRQLVAVSDQDAQ